MSKRTVFCTSFCNFGHILETGRPVDHECYVLPPAMLYAEQAGDMDAALRLLAEKGKGPIVNGRPLKK
jgi:hypothetical protein